MARRMPPCQMVDRVFHISDLTHLRGDWRRHSASAARLHRLDEKNTPGRSRGRREGKGLIETESDRKGIQFDPEESATQET